MDRYYAQLSPTLAPIANAIRVTVHRSAPELSERLYMGVPTWFGARPVCYLADYDQHLNLGFHRGAHLRDPSGLLEGTGKNLRHVKIRTVGATRSRALRELIAEAAAEGARLSAFVPERRAPWPTWRATVLGRPHPRDRRR